MSNPPTTIYGSHHPYFLATNIFAGPTAWAIVCPMTLCTEKTNTQSLWENSEVNLDPQERQRLHDAMVVLGVALKKLRIKKLSRDSHQRRYARWGHIDRLKARSFAKSPRGREYYRQYNKERRKRPHYHLRNWLYGTINRALRSQNATRCGSAELLSGCSRDELRKHLESQLPSGVVWEVNRPWHVDHIVPTSAFNLCDPEEQKLAFNYKNMRPLDPKENQRKSNKLPSPLPSWLPAHIAERITSRRRAPDPAATSSSVSTYPKPVQLQHAAG